MHAPQLWQALAKANHLLIRNNLCSARAFALALKKTVRKAINSILSYRTNSFSYRLCVSKASLPYFNRHLLREGKYGISLSLLPALSAYPPPTSLLSPQLSCIHTSASSLHQTIALHCNPEVRCNAVLTRSLLTYYHPQFTNTKSIL